MTELVDLFPGFKEERIEGAGAELYCRIGGSGPPLVLIHGYPQCNVMWHKVAPALAEHFTCILPDLRGYGKSSVPRGGGDYSAYSKRAMAGDIVAVMKKLGHERFHIAGHDRGARVSYRLALDHPDAVERLAVLDILPTYEYWQRMDLTYGVKMYHWMFLAQPEPLPEMLIGKAPVQFFNYTLASWTKAGNLSGFDERALEHYRDFFSDPDHMHATCEDYRSGATIDNDHDTTDITAGNKITCPVLAVWGGGGLAPTGEGQLDVWQRWASNVRGVAVDSGHFVAEENPEATLDALLPFLLEET